MKDYSAKLYKSKQWQHTRQAYLASVGGLCERCYAKGLIADGYLEEVTSDGKKSFTNIFDEIARLQQKYEDEKNNLNEDMAGMPECLKVERATVLNNILSVLDHLASLKK